MIRLPKFMVICTQVRYVMYVVTQVIEQNNLTPSPTTSKAKERETSAQAFFLLVFNLQCVHTIVPRGVFLFGHELSPESAGCHQMSLHDNSPPQTFFSCIFIIKKKQLTMMEFHVVWGQNILAFIDSSYVLLPKISNVIYKG